MDLSAVALAKEEADARRAPGGETGKLLVFRYHQNALILRVHDCQSTGEQLQTLQAQVVCHIAELVQVVEIPLQGNALIEYRAKDIRFW